jgi:hypothetical protein
MSQEFQAHDATLHEAVNHCLRTNVVLYESAGQTIRLNDLVENDYAIEDPRMKRNTVVMLNEMRRYFGNLSEATKAMQVGTFERYAFDVVRAVFPNLVAHHLVSVQPMLGPVQLVWYQKFVYAMSKGAVVAGQDLIENPNHNYAGEKVENEGIGTGTGAATQFQATLAWKPVRPGSIVITDGAQIATDDGNGNIVGDIQAGTNTINYGTGAIDLTFAAAPAAAEPVSATYEFIQEGNTQLPEVDLVMTSSSVEARRHSLRTKWSMEAQQDLQSQLGMDAEVELVAGVANELRFETDQDIIRDVLLMAHNDVAAFSTTPLAGVSYTEHKLELNDTITKMSNAIFKQTGRAVGSWIVAGVDVCDIIETLPNFKPTGVLSGRGVYEVGILSGRRVFKDYSLPSIVVGGTTIDGNKRFMVGFKGQQMYETGYIWAPYQLFYTTPTVRLDDFLSRKGVATRYGKKPVDSRFYQHNWIT